MKEEYDFSKAERGKFYRPGARLVQPVHLGPEVLAFLTARAGARYQLERPRQRTSQEGHRADRGRRVSRTADVAIRLSGKRVSQHLGASRGIKVGY
jgi:hypothetical protein